MIARPKVSPDVKTDGFDPARALDPKRALVPAVVKVNEERVRRGFWPKIVRTASKIPFAADAIFGAMLALVGRYVKPHHKAEARAFLDRQAQDKLKA